MGCPCPDLTPDCAARRGQTGASLGGHLDLCRAAGRCTLRGSRPWAQRPGLAHGPASGL